MVTMTDEAFKQYLLADEPDNIIAIGRALYKEGKCTYGELMMSYAQAIRSAELRAGVDKDIAEVGWNYAKKVWKDHAPRP